MLRFRVYVLAGGMRNYIRVEGVSDAKGASRFVSERYTYCQILFVVKCPEALRG